MIGLLLILFAQSGDAQAAAAAFQEGRLEDARIIYDKMLAQAGADGGALHANLGHCALQLGRPAQALFHYLQAKRWLPDEPELAFARDLAERRLGLIAAPPPTPYEAWLKEYDSWAPAQSLFLIGLGGACGGVGIVLLRRRAWIWLSALLVFLALSGTWRLLDRTWLASPTGMVLDAGASVRSQPHTGWPVLLKLPPGVRVRVVERSDRWIRIQRAQDEGWIQAVELGLLPAGTD